MISAVGAGLAVLEEFHEGESDALPVAAGAQLVLGDAGHVAKDERALGPRRQHVRRRLFFKKNKINNEIVVINPTIN